MIFSSESGKDERGKRGQACLHRQGCTMKGGYTFEVVVRAVGECDDPNGQQDEDKQHKTYRTKRLKADRLTIPTCEVNSC